MIISSSQVWIMVVFFFFNCGEAAASVESMKPVPCLQDDQFLVAYICVTEVACSVLENWTGF